MTNFLKYQIRNIDGKRELFDENGEQIWTGQVIHQDATIYFITWGVFEYIVDDDKEYPEMFYSLSFDGSILWKEAETAVQFEQNGRVGWKNPARELVMPPIFKQIEICERFIYASYGNRELFVYKNGGLSDCCNFHDNFYQNGKIGLKDHDENILFPVIYDEIYQWNDCDVFYTRIGSDFHYYDSNHEEILTKYRKFENIDDEFCPYYLHEEQSRGVLVTMQLTDTLSDPQSCVCYGNKIKLDRILKSKVDEIVSANCEVWNKGVHELKDFDSYYTYIYSAYWAKSESETPIEDCINQFVKMNCYNTTWNYIIKIWTNRNTTIANSELNKLVVHFQDLEEALFGICSPMDFVTIGYDDTLKDGEVKMFQVKYFTDRPPNEFDDMLDDALSGDINNYIEKKQMLLNALNHARIDEKWDDNYYFSEYNALFDGHSIGYGNKLNQQLIDYLVDKEKYSIKQTVFRICQHLHIRAKYSSWLIKVDDLQSLYKKIKWAISKGSCLTFVIKKQSCLDLIQEAVRFITESDEKGLKTKLAIFKKIERLLLLHGCLAAEEIRRQNFNPLESNLF